MKDKINFILEESPFKFYEVEIKEINKVIQVGGKKYVSGDLKVEREGGRKEAKLKNLKFELIGKNKDVVRIKSIFSKAQLNLMFLLETEQNISLRKALYEYGILDVVFFKQEELKDWMLIPFQISKSNKTITKEIKEKIELGKEFLSLNKSVFGLEWENYLDEESGIWYFKVDYTDLNEFGNAMQTLITLETCDLLDEEDSLKEIEEYNKRTLTEKELISKYKWLFFSITNLWNEYFGGKNLAVDTDWAKFENKLTDEDYNKLYDGAIVWLAFNKNKKAFDAYLHEFYNNGETGEFLNGLFREKPAVKIEGLVIKKSLEITDSQLDASLKQGDRIVYKNEYESGGCDWLEDYLGVFFVGAKEKNIERFEEIYETMLKYYKNWCVVIREKERFENWNIRFVLEVYKSNLDSKSEWFQNAPCFIYEIYKSKEEKQGYNDFVNE